MKVRKKYTRKIVDQDTNLKNINEIDSKNLKNELNNQDL